MYFIFLTLYWQKILTILGHIYATHSYFASMIKVQKLISSSNYKGLKSSSNYAFDLNGKYKPKIVCKNRTDKKTQISKFNFLNLNFHHQLNFWLRVHTILYVLVSITLLICGLNCPILVINQDQDGNTKSSMSDVAQNDRVEKNTY